MNTKTQLFGEMELNLNHNYDQIRKKAFHIAECCGYSINSKQNESIFLYSQDYDIIKIFFENNKVSKVLKSEDNGQNFEELDIKQNQFKVSDTTLINYNSKINYGNETSLPFCQGHAINMLIDRYKIPVLRYGYHFNLIGIETRKQFLLWRDQGHELEFLGIINKALEIKQ